VGISAPDESYVSTIAGYNSMFLRCAGRLFNRGKFSREVNQR